MAAKRKYYRWSAKIDRGTLPRLQALAESLGFIVTTPGGKMGDPSPPALLDALATAYNRDPEVVTNALRQIGVVNPPSSQP